MKRQNQAYGLLGLPNLCMDITAIVASDFSREPSIAFSIYKKISKNSYLTILKNGRPPEFWPHCPREAECKLNLKT